MLKTFRSHLINHFEEDIAAILMLAVLVVLMLQVVSRYVVGDPFSWTEEVARHLFVWMAFFGASAAVRTRAHVAIDLVTVNLPARLRMSVAIAMNVLIIFFLGNVLFWGSLAVARMWSVPTATLEIPTGLVYAVLPFTAALMIVRTIVQIGEDVRNKGLTPIGDMTGGETL